MAWSFGIKAMFVTIIASFFLILTGMLYFMFTLWIVKMGVKLILPDMWNSGTVEGSYMVLSAALISAGSMIASATQRH
ncbi:MAG TPA: hypothetical protein VEC16_01250 [Alphaproteobacteria bacterium]|nr:hypothetical protein [Alphaproteobacteria bacterium]